jgi:hypothetical protein
VVCGWGTEKRWLGAGQAWQPVGGGVAAAKAGELVEFHRLERGGPGLVAIGEGRDDGRQSLWVSADGGQFALVPVTGGPERGDSVSGFVQLADRIVAVGEHWDPEGKDPGIPAVWIGLLR